MSQEHTYTYKQILIGLRDECLEAKAKLDKLKEHVFIFDKNQEDYYFNLYNSPYDKHLPELTLDRDIPQTKLRYIINGLTCNRKPTRVFMAQDNNGRYHAIRPHYYKKGDFNVIVKPLSENEFKELVEELLNSDYAQFMTLPKQIKSVDETPYPRIVNKSFSFDLVAEKGQLEYEGRKDLITFSSIRQPQRKWEPLTQDYLNYLSQIEFPKELFPEYHQSLIDKKVDDDRPLILFDEYQPSLHTDFKIMEEEKKLVLVKQ